MKLPSLRSVVINALFFTRYGVNAESPYSYCYFTSNFSKDVRAQATDVVCFDRDSVSTVGGNNKAKPNFQIGVLWLMCALDLK